MESVLFPVVLGSHPMVLTTMVNFLVIDPLKEAPVYNAIINWTILCAIKVATFIYYLKMKFTTLFIVGEVCGD